jgi:hypothetical protein
MPFISRYTGWNTVRLSDALASESFYIGADNQWEVSKMDVCHISYHTQVYFVFKSHFLVPPTSLTSGIDRIADMQLHMWLACEMLLGVGVHLKLCGTKMLLGYFLLFSGFTFLKSQSAMNVVTDLHSMQFLYGLWHFRNLFALLNLHVSVS